MTGVFPKKEMIDKYLATPVSATVSTQRIRLQESTDAPIFEDMTCSVCGSSRMRSAQLKLGTKRMAYCEECGTMKVEVDGVKSIW